MSRGIAVYATAKGYCQCAILIVGNPVRFLLSDDTTFILGFHMLTGFAVELYLKAFLLSTGVSEEKLSRKPFGHDLASLYSEAAKQGLKCEAGAVLSEYLAQHTSLEYRYMKENSSYPLMRIDLLFEHLSALDTYVDAAVGASSSRGRGADGGWIVSRSTAEWRLPRRS